jgi:glycine/D-amino acid oxidase-like deaminating enzyme
MLSYWESQLARDWDLLIIGGGLAGLSTAASVLARRPGTRVAVLERGMLSWGASTRNAGFACFGSASELLEDLEREGADAVLTLVEQRRRGLELLLDRCGRDEVGHEPCGGYELLGAPGEGAVAVDDLLERANQLLMPLFREPVFARADARIGAQGLRDTRHLLFNRHEGCLDSDRLLVRLWQRVAGAGALLLGGADVERYEAGPQGYSVLVREPGTSRQWRWQGRALALCTNAFTTRLRPELDVVPARGVVLVSGPLPGLRLHGTFHAERGYYYFRPLPGQRLLIGGARHLHRAAETSERFEVSGAVQGSIEAFARRHVDPRFRTELAWAGIMAFGGEKRPLVAGLDDGAVVVARQCGMGVALSATLGERAADLLVERL